jgi:hypothetical protein
VKEKLSNLLQKNRKEIQQHKGTVTNKNIPMYSKAVIFPSEIELEEEDEDDWYSCFLERRCVRIGVENK